MNNSEKIAIVAIVRDEEPFLDEWLLYHHLFVKVDHFFVYNDNPAPGLQDFLQPHAEYATVTGWHDQHQNFSSPRGDRQTKAYLHALGHHLPEYRWVTFVDVDEFIVLKKHDDVKSFLASLGNAPAITLNWHKFGHCGHYENPRGLVTAKLTRRKLLPSVSYKNITRCDAIRDIQSAHRCALKHGRPIDANGKTFRSKIYPGITDAAHINHYMCRSFSHWMNRANQGYTCDVPKLPENTWRDTKEGCLRKFVEEVALDWNEHVDEEMLKYKPTLEREVEAIRQIRDKP
jgi:hypothetical protein